MQHTVPSSPPADPCDVLVIGGGPAGATAASFLATGGRDTVLLEKDVHPRFHIGESLLPRNMDIFDRLGLRAEVARLGLFKPGAEFVSDTTGDAVLFDFSRAIGAGTSDSYHIVRSELDELLFAHARRQGARAWERTRVTAVRPADAAGRLLVTALDEATGDVRCFAPKFVLDASGRDTFMATQLKTKHANKNNNTAAVFAHYHNVEARQGDREGYISVHLAADGWFWMIPLPRGLMSVGFVGSPAAFKGRTGSMEDFLAARIAMSPTVRARMVGAERVSPVTGTGNYSYAARSCWGENYMMIGDSFAFIDPVFSSGVFLAMTGGESGAEIAAAWIDNPARGRAMARKSERRIRNSMERISWLIYRINTPVMRSMFLSPSNRWRMRDGLTALLTGNLGADPRLLVPVLAFKTAYYMLSLLRWLGVDIDNAPMAPAESR